MAVVDHRQHRALGIARRAWLLVFLLCVVGCAQTRLFGRFLWGTLNQPETRAPRYRVTEPRVPGARLVATWVGHATVLIELGDFDAGERLLRKHRKGIVEAQFAQKRLADAVADIFAQIAVLSRVTSIFEDQGVEPSGQERYIAETFCERAAARVRRNFGQLERNDDERMKAIAKLAYKRGEYGYALFD